MSSHGAADSAHTDPSDALPSDAPTAQSESTEEMSTGDMNASHEVSGGSTEHPVNASVLETIVDRGATVHTDSVTPAPPTRSVASGRAEARERAIHLLYEREIKGSSVTDLLEALPLPPDPYTQDVLRGVEQHQEELDSLIGRLARGWTLKRMPRIDLTILRVGAFELLYRNDIPTGVVLSEAAELATLYGGLDESGRFVNGVLAAAARETRS